MSELEDITPEGSASQVFLSNDPVEEPDHLPGPSVDDLRREQYARRADPLFFKWQMQLATGDGDPEETRLAWLAERAAIQAEFPGAD